MLCHAEGCYCIGICAVRGVCPNGYYPGLVPLTDRTGMIYCMRDCVDAGMRRGLLVRDVTPCHLLICPPDASQLFCLCDHQIALHIPQASASPLQLDVISASTLSCTSTSLPLCSSLGISFCVHFHDGGYYSV